MTIAAARAMGAAGQRGIRVRIKQRERPKADPRRFGDQFETEHSHHQTEPELKSSADRRRDRLRKPPDPAGDAQHQQHKAQHDAGGGDPAGTKAAGQDHRRYSLHRLHRKRQAVKKTGGDEKDAEAEEDARRCKAGDGHRPDHMRDKGAEITARSGGLLSHRAVVTRGGA
jgi:hypothetical protein